MSASYKVFVCVSHRAKVHGGGCCNDKGSERMLPVLAEIIAENNLGDSVVIHPSACMSNCPLGISIRVMPGNVRYSRVKLADLEEIVQEHFIKGEPVERLITEPIRRFSSF